MRTKVNLYISLWWFVQLCGLLILGIRHLGHLFVVLLLLVSLAGYVFGGRKVAIVGSFGLASYAALSFLGAIVLCYLAYQEASVLIEWLLPAVAMVVAILNLIISFKIIKGWNDERAVNDSKYEAL